MTQDESTHISTLKNANQFKFLAFYVEMPLQSRNDMVDVHSMWIIEERARSQQDADAKEESCCCA